MGQDIVCSALVDGRADKGKALLETSELVFRGTARVAIRFSDVRSVSVQGDDLIIGHPGGVLSLRLGANAERWAEKIRNPPGLMDKLGVKPGMRVAVLGIPGFAEDVTARGAVITRLPRRCDLVFLGVETAAGLAARLSRVEQSIARDGAIWAVHPKGRRDFRDVDVIAAAKEAGLVDVKVVRFSDTHSALKLVIPVALR